MEKPHTLIQEEHKKLPLTAEMISYFEKNSQITLNGNNDITYIKFLPIDGMIRSTYNRKGIVTLSADVDGYDDLPVVYFVKDKKIAMIDEEHSKVHILGGFNYFIENTQKCVDSVFE